MEYQYTDEELSRLHDTLYDILHETIRVCHKLNIRYFIIGGTCIGAFFWKGIIPWDDDIDIGMTREDDDRFLAEAPAELGKDYFLQWYKTDRHAPFFFAKVRKHNTLFLESMFSRVPMHHGIFVDVFPFDKVPRSRTAEKIQFHAMGFLNACFIAKEVWQYKWCGKCEVPEPRPRGFVPCLMTRITNAVLPKSAIYRLMTGIQTMFNGCGADRYNLMSTDCDHISVGSINNLQTMTFGPLEVAAPADVETYLNNHYPGLQKYPPVEQRKTHRPARLDFG